MRVSMCRLAEWLAEQAASSKPSLASASRETVSQPLTLRGLLSSSTKCLAYLLGLSGSSRESIHVGRIEPYTRKI